MTHASEYATLGTNYLGGKMHPLTKWVIDKIEKEYKDDVAL